MSGIKNFLLTFCISVLIFGLLAYFVMDTAAGTLFDTDGEKDGNDDQTDDVGTGDELNPGSYETDADGNLIFYDIKSESFTVLLVGTDYQPDILFDYDLTILNDREKQDAFPYRERIISADAIVLIHIDKETKEFAICSIPGNTRVKSGGVDQTLGELYDSKGIEYLSGKVAALTGINVDYYAAMSLSDFAYIVDTVGGIIYDVPCEMYYEDASQGLVISLPKGQNNLSGDKALQLLRFNNYTDGKNTRAKTIGTFARALLDKMTDANYISQAPALYQLWQQVIETNFTLADLTEHIDLIFAYPSFSVIEKAYPGEYRTSGDEVYFNPNTTEAYKLFDKYKTVEEASIN